MKPIIALVLVLVVNCSFGASLRKPNLDLKRIENLKANKWG